jgi:hypothetical protein
MDVFEQLVSETLWMATGCARTLDEVERIGI